MSHPGAKTTVIFVIAAALTAFNPGGSGGCGNGTTATEPLQIAKIAQSDVPDNMLSLLTALRALTPDVAVSGLTLSPSLVDGGKGLIEVSAASSCASEALPAVGVPPTFITRILPFQVNGGISGSCGFTADVVKSGNVTAVSAIFDCVDLVIGEELDGGETRDATYNGRLGFEGTITDEDNGQETLDFNASSKGLALTLGPDAPCDVDMNLSLTAILDPSNSGTLQENGCLIVCGQDFSVGGTQTVP